MEDAFAGNEKLLGDISGWLERLLASFSENKNSEGFNAMDWQDLPSTWWKNPNQLTSGDIQGFRALPGLMSSAVRNGVSGIRVSLDGQTVGSLVAPYVSQYIARDVN